MWGAYCTSYNLSVVFNMYIKLLSSVDSILTVGLFMACNIYMISKSGHLYKVGISQNGFSQIGISQNGISQNLISQSGISRIGIS